MAEEQHPDAVPTPGITGSVLAGSAWTSANIILPYVLASIVSIVAARVLGPSEMGRQSFIAFVTLIATSICAAGLPLALTRSVGAAIGSGRPETLPGLVRSTWLAEAPLALGGTLVLLVVAAMGAEPRAAWVMAALTVFAGTLATVPQALFSGVLEWRGYAVVVLRANVVATALTLAALAAGFGITGIVAVRLAQTLVVAAWTSSSLRSVLHRYAPRPRRDRELERSMLRFGAGSSLSVLLMLIVYQRSELFFLNHFSSDAEIADYAIASSALTILLAAPQALGIALAPALSSLHGAGESDRVRAGFSKAVRISLLGAMALLGLAAIVGPSLLVIVYGDAYEGVKDVFLILLPSLLAVPLISASSAVLIAHRRVRLPLLAVAAAAAVDLGVAYALVPDHDATGAAVASVSALVVAACFQLVLALRILRVVDVHVGQLLRAAVTSALATAVGLAVLYVVPGWPEIVAASAAFALAFAGLAAALRPAAPEDARWLAGLAGRAHPRAGRLVATILRATDV